jgi:DNA (cytosine-5)-methyltransferase 1
MTIKYIDLFAGVGGFRVGINKAHPNWECVYSNEYDKYANSVYKKHYERCDDRDIRTVKTEEIPDHDLLVGGFPCQAFSVAGKRRGFEDTRGTLFFEIARIAKQKQPRLLLLENVKGLLSHDSGNTFKTILRSLDELGYDCQWQVLNSKDFGVPQNRERVFIIGHLRGTSRPEVFPIGQCDSGFNESNVVETQANIARTIDTRTGSYPKWGQYIRQIAGGQGNRVYMDDGLSTTIASQAGGQGAKTGLYAIKKLGNIYPSGSENGDVISPDGISKTLKSGENSPKILENMKIRRLTPVECERLQGFPDNWTKYGQDNKEMSDTQRYKMMGNAVTTNVVTSIVRKLL